MNFELSLALLWLALFALLSLPDFFHIIYNIYTAARVQKSPRQKFLSALPLYTLFFPLYLSLSLLWSAFPLRTFLTVGVLWCLYISIFTLLKTFLPLARSQIFSRVFLYSSASACLFCWLQCFLDVSGVGRETTLLCLGCTSAMFGFPHPSGFAIEPQFMGNLLLAPALYLLYLFSRPVREKGEPSHLSLAFVVLSTLFLTLSRGAIYSFAVAYLMLFILNLAKLSNRRFFYTLPLLTFSFSFALLSQGVFAELSPTSDTFLSGIDKSISQLSLGKIELNLSAPFNTQNAQTTETVSSETAEPTTEDVQVASVFSGYVEESTNTRLRFNSLALELSSKAPLRLLFGTGLGSAGTVMFEEGKTETKYEIIQNEYLSLLLEAGLFGLLLATAAFAVIIYLLQKSAVAPAGRCLLYAVFLAFLLSLNFFSGLPNALHLYLFPVFLFLLLPEHKSVVHQKVNHHHHRRHQYKDTGRLHKLVRER